MNNVAVLGQGGREQALAWKLSQSEKVKNVFLIPGNGFDSNEKIKNCKLDPNDFTKLVEFLKSENIDLTIVGPEALLTRGVVDALEKNNLKILGPNQYCAQIEGSKLFSKELMVKFEIPTAKYMNLNIDDPIHSKIDLWDESLGYVVKVDELAAGKGVVVCDHKDQAKAAVDDFLFNKNCKIKSQNVLIEEKLIGKEYSFFALCNGESFIPLGHACDYKRVFNGDTGPNTGGMGGYHSPSELTQDLVDEIYDVSIGRLLKGLSSKGINYQGFLFAGIMLCESGFKVLEYNVRMGDPESQILLPLVNVDFYNLCMSTVDGNLEKFKDEHNDRSSFLRDQFSVHVVMSSKNYPSIDGTPLLLNQVIKMDHLLAPESFLFTAGVKPVGMQIQNSGGRVLGITSLGNSLAQAREQAYQEIAQINFEGAHFREDIAHE